METERQGIIVYLHYNRDVRKLSKFGDIIYHSYKMRYVHLYVEVESYSETLASLKQMKFVKKALPSYYNEIDMDFVGSLERYDTSVPEAFKNFSL